MFFKVKLFFHFFLQILLVNVLNERGRIGLMNVASIGYVLVVEILMKAETDMYAGDNSALYGASWILYVE